MRYKVNCGPFKIHSLGRKIGEKNYKQCTKCYNRAVWGVWKQGKSRDDRTCGLGEESHGKKHLIWVMSSRIGTWEVKVF